MKKTYYINIIIMIIIIIGGYKLYTVNINHFQKDEILNLQNLNLQNKDIKKIIKYAENNNIKKINLKNNPNINNLNLLIDNKGIYKFEELILGNINNYYFENANNYIEIKDKLLDLENKYGKITFDKCNNKNHYETCINYKINFSDLLKRNKSIQLYYDLKNKVIKVNRIDIDNIYDKNINNLYYYLDDFNFYNDNKLKTITINYSQKIVSGKNFDKLLSFYTKIHDTGNQLFINGYASEYFAKYFYQSSEKTNNIVKYENKDISNDIINKLIFNYKNIEKLILNNINTKGELNIDLNKTNIKNYNLKLNKLKYKISNLGNKHNILIQAYKKNEITGSIEHNKKIYSIINLQNNDQSIKYYSFGKDFNDFLFKSIDKQYIELLLKLDYYLSNNLTNYYKINDEIFERIWIKNKSIGNNNRLTNQDLTNIINKNKEYFNYDKKTLYNKSEKENFRKKIDIILSSKKFKDVYKKYLEYAKLIIIYNNSFNIDDNLIIDSYIKKLDFTKTLKNNYTFFNQVYNYKDTYIFIKYYNETEK